MHRLWLFPLGLLLTLTGDFGQTSSTDSQTLEALLAEVRQLRQDLRTTTVAAQRVQILLYRLQGQEAAVARASQRLDDARAKLAETRTHREKLAFIIKQNEDFVSNTENPPAARKESEEVISGVKPDLETAGNDEQQRQAREIEAEQDLRAEQAKLGALQDQLDRLDKTLESSSTGLTK